MHQLLRVFVYCLSFIIRSKRILLFTSFPDLSDNPYALYLYLVHHPQYDSYKKVWILEKPNDELINVIRSVDAKTIISCSTLRNWYYVIVARFIFSSHNSYGYLRFRQPHKLMNLWHGMPLKKIGYDNNENPVRKRNYFSTVATNDYFAKCLSSAFEIPMNNILVVGYPRNDLLFEKGDYIDRILKSTKYNSIGMWMPTFRTASRNNMVQSDSEMRQDEFNYWNPDVLGELDTFLQKTNNALLLKLHPADIMQTKENSKEYSNLYIIRNADMPPRETYRLLGAMDYLISDYSSVITDFDILGKPMGFIISDLNSYQIGRAMNIVPTKDNLPGKVIANMTDLKEFISHHSKYIRETGTLYNIYKDNHNCERLVNSLNL